MVASSSARQHRGGLLQRDGHAGEAERCVQAALNSAKLEHHTLFVPYRSLPGSAADGRSRPGCVVFACDVRDAAQVGRGAFQLHTGDANTAKVDTTDTQLICLVAVDERAATASDADNQSRPDKFDAYSAGL